MDDVGLLDATAQAELVRRGEVTALELVEAALARVERLNPTLNAVITPLPDAARAAASSGGLRGPFAGVPFLLKDLIASCAGARMTWGSAALRGFVPDHDSELVTRLRRAGLVVLGKTNTAEFGILPTTEPRAFGPSRDPWEPTRTTGGSSGGSAAAVAARLVPMAHANDAGGSIRIPASCCGVFGLKPTRGRISLGPDLGDALGGLVVEHAVTWSVRDSAALLDATAGPAPGDPYWAPPPARPYRLEVGADPGRLRIAVTTAAATGVPVHADCVSAVQDAARLCATPGPRGRRSGARRGRGAPDPGLPHRVGRRRGRDGRGDGGPDRTPADGRDVRAAHLGALRDGPSRDRSSVPDGRAHPPAGRPGRGPVLRGPRRLADADARRAAGAAGHLRGTAGPAAGGARPGHRLRSLHPIANVTGQPAMSVPLSWNPDGLPIGSHFVARFGDEATLFRLAAQLEAARPWADRRPPLSAV